MKTTLSPIGRKLARPGPKAIVGIALIAGLAMPALAVTLAAAPAFAPEAPLATATTPNESTAMAAALSAYLDAGVPNTLAGTVDFVNYAAGLQEASLGVAGTNGLPVVAHAAPSAAVLALAASLGVEPSLADTLAIAKLDLMAEPARSAVARLVDSFLAHHLTVEAAFATVDVALIEKARADPSDPAVQFENLGIDYASAFATRAVFLQAVVELREALDSTRADADPVQVPLVVSLDFAVADNTYTGDFRLMWDEGGNDIYLNNAGGNGICAEQCDDSLPGGAGALVDGSGNDQYVAYRGQGTNGGGFAGSGLLIDEMGNDVYLARDDGTNGAGFAGIGLLIEQGGDDSFTAWGWGVNGGGYPGGVGFLFERGGSDSFVGSFEAVNGGSDFGRGLLVEESGNDYYEAEVAGVNGGGLGGIGLLLDRAGVDVYNDNAGGSGTDMTVIPKELNGAQVDQ